MNRFSRISAFEESDYQTERGKPLPNFHHGIIQSSLGFQLNLNYRKRFRIASELHVDLLVRERVPDLAIYESTPFDPDDNPLVMSAPLGAIEILSEMQSISVLKKKSKEYFNADTRSYWLVLPSFQSIYVFSSPNDYEIYRHTDILKDKILDIELDLSEVFS
jgi:Uma2 family endonuclease